MAPMHLVFLIFSLAAFSHIADSSKISENSLKAALEEVGLRTFASLIGKTGVLKAYVAAEMKNNGVTIFAPSNSAFTPKILEALKTLTPDQVVALLKYHAVEYYVPFRTLLTESKGFRFPTLATGDSGKYTLYVGSDGGNLTVDAGENSAGITSTILKFDPLAVYEIDNVLLPSEIFGKSPARSRRFPLN